jgi:hypothetical protein
MIRKLPGATPISNIYIYIAEETTNFHPLLPKSTPKSLYFPCPGLLSIQDQEGLNTKQQAKKVQMCEFEKICARTGIANYFKVY